MNENFLSRWSKRKLEAKEKPAETELTPSVLKPEGGSSLPAPPGQGTGSDQLADTGRVVGGAPEANAQPEAPVPTEADLQGIEQGGDVKAFLSDKVSTELKNKAFKALFSRPEYNVMDGLDIYIEDYNTFVPLSQEQIGKMTFSKQLLSRPDLEKLAEEAEKASTPAIPTTGESASEDGELVMDNSEAGEESRVNPSDENPNAEQVETLDEQGFKTEKPSNSNSSKST